jgi:hypothetical protein
MELWKAYRSVAGSLQEEASAQAGNPDPPRFEPDKALARERDRALLRARVSLALLRLSGGAGSEKVETALRQAERLPADNQVWKSLRSELRLAWQRHEADLLRREAQ